MTAPIKAGFLLIGGLVMTAVSYSGTNPAYERLVIRRSANSAVVEAAHDLADIIEQTTGTKPDIRWRRMVEFQKSIIIGAAPQHPAFDNDPLTDEVVVERTQHGIEISGSDNTATGFAVYRFIEQFLGWRYYHPGELGLERLDDPPPAPALAGRREILLLEKAGFYSRNLYTIESGQTDINWSNWNGLREKFTFNHHLHRIITPELFSDHPEWFAKRAGGQPKQPPYKRTHGENDHPDLTSEEVRNAAVEAFKASFPEAGTDQDYVTYSLSLADSFQFGWYPASYRWRPESYFRRWPDWSNHVFDFTNAVAEKISGYWNTLHPVAGKRPPVYLGALSYLTWEKAPGFAVSPAIVPYLTYDRSQWYDPTARMDDLANVESWAKKDTPVLGTWDYLFGYGFLMPRSMVEIVSTSIPSLYDRGVRAYFSQVMPVWPFDLHTTWLTGRLLWNPTADAARLLEEFFHEYYGPAATAMRPFFQIAEKTWMQQEGNNGEMPESASKATGWWLRWWKDPWQASLWKQTDLDRMDRLLETALEWTAEEGNQRFHRRIRQTADLFAATKTFVAYQHALWRVSTGTVGHPSADTIELRKQLGTRVSAAIRNNPNAENAGDLSWIDRYDSSGAMLYRLTRDSDRFRPQLTKWCERQGFTGIPGLEIPASEIRLPPFDTLTETTKWQLSMLDAEEAAIATGKFPGELAAKNVRRGQVYLDFLAQGNDFYLAQVDVETSQSPTGEIYVRIDFFDDDHRLLQSSNRARIAPTDRYGEQQTLLALAQAPDSTAAARLVIRFYEMDRNSQAIVTNPRLFRMGPDPFR